MALVPAAEYLRMSTEHQQYSLENQAAAIRRYACANGFEVIQTYADPARSGLVLKHRPGLARLLGDVVGDAQPYRAILVYDVSRWGRFQDADESAYYEFLCKNAGVPIHYCAETFVNDGTMPSVVMKALKRVMAAEYSRDLSCKVFEGEKRINQLGFRTGGIAGYGFRRMLCTPEGRHKHILDAGQRKSILADRVILVPGPAKEVETVREIFRMVVNDRKPLYRIAEELNSRGIEYFGKKWVRTSVEGIVRNPKYTGRHVWGRNSKKLGTPSMRNPESAWIVKKNAFEPLVDEVTFTAAQQILTHSKSDEYLLDRLRSLLAREGSLSRRLITAEPGFPWFGCYVKRFGSLRNSYALIGYERRELTKGWIIARRVRQLRSEVVNSLMRLFPNQVRLEQKTKQHRPILHFRGAPALLVIVCHSYTTRTGALRWQLPARLHRGGMALLCRCNPSNSALKDFFLIGKLPTYFQALREDDPRLQESRTTTDLVTLFGARNRIGDLLKKIRSKKIVSPKGHIY